MDGQGRPFQPHPISSAGWQQVYPQGLYDVLVRLRREYASPEVLITENGVPDDVSDSGQPTADRARSPKTSASWYSAVARSNRIQGE
jgi:beta-glucosidase